MAEQPTISAPLNNQASPGNPDRLLDTRLFIVVTILLVMVAALLIASLAFQWRNYNSGIATALSATYKDHAAVLSYARALDAAFAKTSALFLGFLLVLVGILFVLRAAGVGYRITAEGSMGRGTLETSSPGLVIATLGVVLIALTILGRTDVNYQAPSPYEDTYLSKPTPNQRSEETQILPTVAPPSERPKE